MVTIEGAYEGALRAFQSPMLALLHKRNAPLVVTLLASVFTVGRASVPVADAHTELGDALDRLRAAGHEDLPPGTARDLARQWVDAGWLVRQVESAPARAVAGEPRGGDGDVEVYRLSAHAVGALEVAGRAGGPRARVSQSRVRTLLDAVDRLAQDADPDVETRRARLRAERARVDRELERLERTGVVDVVADETLLEEAENVLSLVRELPADFARVAESIKALQREVVSALRQDDRPTGEVLREYLDAAEHLLESTAEGRAFSGALRLVGEPEQLDALADHLDLILRQPFTRRLPAQQRAELAGVARRIEEGIDAVLSAQRTASRVITTQVRHHDPLRDRQVDDLLRDVIVELAGWMPSTRRGQPVPALPRLPRAQVGRLRETLDDLHLAQPPAPLPRWEDDDPGSLDDARAWGGPHYADLRAHLAGATGSLAEAFAAAPEPLRRPVDLFGLLELAESLGGVASDDVVEVVAVRPDGTRRRLAFGDVDLSAVPPATLAPPASPAAPADTTPTTSEDR